MTWYFYLNGSNVRCDISGEFNDFFVQLRFDPDLPILDPLADQRLQRRDVNDFSIRKVSEDGQHRDLRHNSFS